MVRFMMSQTTLLKSFWDYALDSDARILNMVLTKKIDKTPYEVWHGQAPKLSYLKFWGSEALVKHEDTHPSKNTSLHHDEDEQEIVKSQSDANVVRRFTKIHHAPDQMCLYVDVEEHELGGHNEPTNYKVDLPPNDKTVGSKWLFKKNTDMDGNVHTCKACYVVKDFTQTYGVDYEETFSHVANIRDIRILIAIAAYNDYEIWQMDIKTTFLNGHLSEEVYMVKPEEILKIFNKENSKRGLVPMQEKIKLSKTQGASIPYEVKRMHRAPYASVVGSIMYAVRRTRPDIELRVTCYTNVGYPIDADDSKYQIGYVFILNGGTVDWKSAKQSIIMTSSTEAEYMAASEASKEAVWIRKFIFRLGVVPINEELINMYCDNTRAIT
ncbi:retrotransposon protein, putative, ty1-copia subclass [Tanacetum coccineum]